MKYALRFGRARWLYLAKRGKNKILPIRGTTFLSIAFNFVDIRGVATTQMANGFDLCNGTIFRIR